MDTPDIFYRLRARGYTVTSLARIFGVDRTTLYRWVKNRSTVHLIALEALASNGRSPNLPRPKPTCVGCGAHERIEVHHKVPKSMGGTNDPENLVDLCDHCHRIMVHGDGLRALNELHALANPHP